MRARSMQTPISGAAPDRTLHELRNPDKPRASHILSQPALPPPRHLPRLAQTYQTGASTMPQSPGTRFTAHPVSFVVRHQLWDGNVEDHVDQGVSIDVTAEVGGKETSLLRFNCFDLERSYVYGPENPDLSTAGRVGGGMGVH